MSAATALSLRKEIREKVGKMSALLDSKEPSAMAEHRALGAEVDKLIAQRDRIESHILERAESMSGGRSFQERPNVGNEYGERTISHAEQVRSTDQYRSQFEHWLKTGESGSELRALGVGGSGAYMVPVAFEKELEKKLKYFGGLYNICRVLETDTGAPLHYPTWDDTANTGEWLAEAAGVGSADPTISEVIFGAYLLSSKQVKLSVQVEQDSAFDWGTVLSDAFGSRMGISLDTALWTGNGSTIPITGLLTALQAAGSRSVLAVGANANDGVSTALNSIGSNDFSALIDKLDRSYQRPTNQFVFSQSTQNSLRKLKDKYGRMLWDVSLAVGEPDKIFGYPFTVDNAFAGIGAGAITVAFGDFSKYVIRRARGFTLVRLDQLYMANFQVAYQAFMRVDAKLIQPSAFSYLIAPLS